jgi:hypothetical protein
LVPGSQVPYFFAQLPIGSGNDNNRLRHTGG